MKGELYINGKDAFTTWGISMEDGGLSALMTPPPMKEMAESKRRTAHGKTVYYSNQKVDEREITLPIHILAASKDEFFERYNAFCEDVLKGGYLKINTKYQEDVYYRCYFLSCTQFSELVREIAKFSLKLVEPDPTNRAAESTTDEDDQISE